MCLFIFVNSRLFILTSCSPPPMCAQTGVAVSAQRLSSRHLGSARLPWPPARLQEEVHAPFRRFSVLPEVLPSAHSCRVSHAASGRRVAGSARSRPHCAWPRPRTLRLVSPPALPPEPLLVVTFNGKASRHGHSLLLQIE